MVFCLAKESEKSDMMLGDVEKVDPKLSSQVGRWRFAP